MQVLAVGEAKSKWLGVLELSGVMSTFLETVQTANESFKQQE